MRTLSLIALFSIALQSASTHAVIGAESPIPACGPPMMPLRILAGQTGSEVLKGHTPQKKAAQASPTPSADDPFRRLPGGAVIRSGQYVIVAADGSVISVSIATPKPTTKASPSPSPGPDASSPSPATQPTQSVGALGPTGQLTAQIKDTNIAVVSTSSPVPQASGDPQEIAVNYTVKGVAPGQTDLIVNDGMSACKVAVHVLPQANRFLLTTGFGGSSVPVNTITQVTVTPPPAGQPAPAASPGVYITQTEVSTGQTFVPLLAHFRITDFPKPFNFYLSGGLATNNDPGKQLFGLSYGNECFLVTAGYHSAQNTLLNRGLALNYNPLSALPAAGAPISYTQRTTRPFASFTLPLGTLASILPGLGSGGTSGNSCTASSSGNASTDSSKASSPSNTPAPAPAATASAK